MQLKGYRRWWNDFRVQLKECGVDWKGSRGNWKTLSKCWRDFYGIERVKKEVERVKVINLITGKVAIVKGRLWEEITIYSHWELESWPCWKTSFKKRYMLYPLCSIYSFYALSTLSMLYALSILSILYALSTLSIDLSMGWLMSWLDERLGKRTRSLRERGKVMAGARWMECDEWCVNEMWWVSILWLSLESLLRWLHQGVMCCEVCEHVWMTGVSARLRLLLTGCCSGYFSGTVSAAFPQSGSSPIACLACV